MEYNHMKYVQLEINKVKIADRRKKKYLNPKLKGTAENTNK